MDSYSSAMEQAMRIQKVLLSSPARFDEDERSPDLKFWDAHSKFHTDDAFPGQVVSYRTPIRDCLPSPMN